MYQKGRGAKSANTGRNCNRRLSADSFAQWPNTGTTGRDAVDRVIQMGILGRYDAYFKMVQFRYFIVYRDEYIDNAVLVDMVNRQLMDFERFRNEMLAYINKKMIKQEGLGL